MTMASRVDFVQYIADQCSGAGEIVVNFYIADVDDRDYLSMLVRETCYALVEPNPKKK